MVEGRYFRPGSTQFVPARAIKTEAGTIRVESETGEALTEARIRDIHISSRLGRTMRRLDFPNGGQFLTEDNDGVDRMLAGLRHVSTRADRIERSLKLVAAAFGLALVCVFVFLRYGIPLMAAWFAAETPPSFTHVMSQQSLKSLDRLVLRPSKLTPQDQAKARALFAKMAAEEPRGVEGYTLRFRNAPSVGPNAFALPDGTIVMTDQLWPFVHADDELEGVFAHEMSHVNRRHGLQSLYQAAIVPAAIALVTGDVSQITQMATILPGILVQSAYSRHFEQQADDDAAATLLRAGEDPAGLAHLLKRLNDKLCGKNGCGPSWLGNHPLTAERVARLLRESRAGRKKTTGTGKPWPAGVTTKAP